jgi:hypothetical protein
MASPDDVLAELWGTQRKTVVRNGVTMPDDAILMYEGADPAKNGFTPWYAWDIRGWLNRLTWDLLRFKKIDDGKPNSDRTVPSGLRDEVNAIHFLTDQNNQILRAIAAKVGADISAVK